MLLKPSLPLAAIDRTFSSGGVFDAAPQVVPPGSHVWATHTGITQNKSYAAWYMVLAITISQPWMLLRQDLWPPLDSEQEVVVWDYTDLAGSAHLVKANTMELTSLQTPPVAHGHAFSYKLVAPVLPGGWALLGETGKMTPVSEQRNWDFDLGDVDSLIVRVSDCAKLETMTIAVWKGGHVYTKGSQIDNQGNGVFVFRV